jgi:hypothetical protein
LLLAKSSSTHTCLIIIIIINNNNMCLTQKNHDTIAEQQLYTTPDHKCASRCCQNIMFAA